MALISLQNISKSYGYIHALRKLSFDIEPNEFISVFGRNGAGKSTLLKLISMQSVPTDGEIIYNDIPIKDLKNEFRSHFGVISHQPFLYDNLSLMENLTFYAKLYNVKNIKENATELLNKLGLYNRRNDIIRTFSRGMLQRASIIRALIHKPDIIFLDEPYTGLDPIAANNLTSLLKGLASDNKTIIMVSHDLPLGYELASRILILEKGKIAHDLSKAELTLSELENIYLGLK